MQRASLCLGGLLALVATKPAAARDTIVVTGTRLGSEAADTTTIEREDIDRIQPATLLEPLDRVAGVRAFSKGGLSFLSIRGGDPNFTLVLLDGARVNDPTNSRGGGFDFEQIDPFAVERIEIARPALSAVHGADALSGVVHLRLRRPAPGERFGAAHATLDTQGAAGLSGTAGYGWSNGGLLASAGGFDSGGLFEGVDLRRGQGFARLTQDAGGFALSALGFHARAERIAFPEDSGGPRLAAVRDRETRDTRLSLASLELAGGAERVQPRLALHWSRQDSDIDTPPIAPGALPGVPRLVADSRFDRIEAIADVRLQATEHLALAAGASWLREKGESDGFIDVGFELPADFAIRRTVRSLFAEARLDAGPADLSVGIRHDDVTRGSATTARASARLRLRPDLSAFADYSEGYKLPSLFALAFPIVANPGLEPEHGRSVTVGLEQNVGDGRVRLAAFESRFRNLIDFDAETFTFVNRARVRSRGVEVEGDVRLGAGVRLQGALTWLDVDNAPGAPPLRSRPEWQGALALDWQASPQMAFSLAGRFNSRFFDSSIPTGLIVQPGHVELDATAVWRIARRLTLRITVRNVASADYEEAVGFPAPGRLVRIGIGSEF